MSDTIESLRAQLHAAELELKAYEAPVEEPGTGPVASAFAWRKAYAAAEEAKERAERLLAGREELRKQAEGALREARLALSNVDSALRRIEDHAAKARKTCDCNWCESLREIGSFVKLVRAAVPPPPPETP